MSAFSLKICIQWIFYKWEQQLQLMPFKAQQNWIIKSVCLYPITAYLWILDFILYNWQQLSGKEGFNSNQIKINWSICHSEEPASSVDELIDGSLWNRGCGTVVSWMVIYCLVMLQPSCFKSKTLKETAY